MRSQVVGESGPGRYQQGAAVKLSSTSAAPNAILARTRSPPCPSDGTWDALWLAPPAIGPLLFSSGVPYSRRGWNWRERAMGPNTCTGLEEAVLESRSDLGGSGRPPRSRSEIALTYVFHRADCSFHTRTAVPASSRLAPSMANPRAMIGAGRSPPVSGGSVTSVTAASSRPVTSRSL